MPHQLGDRPTEAVFPVCRSLSFGSLVVLVRTRGTAESIGSREAIALPNSHVLNGMFHHGQPTSLDPFEGCRLNHWSMNNKPLGRGLRVNADPEGPSSPACCSYPPSFTTTRLKDWSGNG
ncbi:unnamed protein product [Arctogadus glacialis]